MFSHSVGCGLCFHFTAGFLCCVKSFKLIVPFVYFVCLFVSLAKGDMSDKILLREMSGILLPMFSSRIFLFLSLTLKSFIYSEFILVYGVRRCSSLFFLQASVQFFQHHLLNRLSLSHCMFLPPSSNINWLWRHGFISRLFLLFHWSMCVFMPIPCCFDYYGLIL